MVEYQACVSDPLEKPIHAATNESTPDIIEDQVGVNV
jgi:hypothetical protein